MELDFTGPARDDASEPDSAASFFQPLGRTEEIAAGGAFFREGQASDKMYLLTEGEVSLMRGGKALDIVRAGEIFGEIAAITRQPRTASATARGDCRALSLDAGQFQQTIQDKPEFALLLMRTMNNRLRLTLALMGRKGELAQADTREATWVFDKKMLDQLGGALSSRPPQTYPAGRMVMKEGENGLSMYVVRRGTVAVSVRGAVVERVGPGGVFGEMALADQSPRAASAAAEVESVLLSLNRTDFLGLVKSRPDFAVALLKAIAGRLRHMTEQKK